MEDENSFKMKQNGKIGYFGFIGGPSLMGAPGSIGYFMAMQDPVLMGKMRNPVMIDNPNESNVNPYENQMDPNQFNPSMPRIPAKR
jgi:hypothetical protein